ncbi:MAG TPA: nuclear transport factor 2 family protein [Steroidobacteraceae bacterium]
MLTIWAVALMAASGSDSCREISEPHTRAGLLEAEHRWIVSLENREVRSLACLLDDTFTDSGARGTMLKKSEVLARLATRAPGSIEVRDIELRIEGPIGYVRGMALTHRDDGMVLSRARFTDIFLYHGKRWVAVAAQETAITE